MRLVCCSHKHNNVELTKHRIRHLPFVQYHDLCCHVVAAEQQIHERKLEVRTSFGASILLFAILCVCSPAVGSVAHAASATSRRRWRGSAATALGYLLQQHWGSCCIHACWCQHFDCQQVIGTESCRPTPLSCSKPSMASALLPEDDARLQNLACPVVEPTANPPKRPINMFNPRKCRKATQVT